MQIVQYGCFFGYAVFLMNGIGAVGERVGLG
jgi:hypothetical protein